MKLTLTLRDLFWLTLVAAILVFWWVKDGRDRQELAKERQKERQDVARENYRLFKSEIAERDLRFQQLDEAWRQTRDVDEMYNQLSAKYLEQKKELEALRSSAKVARE